MVYAVSLDCINHVSLMSVILCEAGALQICCRFMSKQRFAHQHPSGRYQIQCWGVQVCAAHVCTSGVCSKPGLGC